MTGKRLALGLILILATGCTRQMNDNVKISLSLPSNSGQTVSGSQPTHIVINVRGPLMPNDVVWNWDAHQGGNIVAPPTAIYLDVPKGADRLFQILVVNENESGQMEFLYGDVVKSLAASAEDVSISVVSIGNGSGLEAEVGGRYVKADGTYPTGDLELMFQPPGTGRPAMKIFSTAMISGWFSMFLVDGAPFSYRWVHDGTYLFTNAAIGDAEFSPVGDINYKIHIKRPAGWSYYQKSGGVYVTEARGAARLIYGYFGPGAATYGKPVCYTAAQAMQSFYTDSAHTTAMQYDPTVTTITKAIRLNNLGGLPDTDSSCTSGTSYVDRLMFDGKYAGNGKDQAFGFRGSFKNPPNSSAISSSYNSGTQDLTLSWNALPGVSGAIDGYSVYAHPNFSGSMEMGGDGIDCEKLVGLGFSFVGDTTSSSYSFYVTTANQSTTKAAVCPFKNGYAGKAKYLFTGARYENYGGGGGGGSPATKLTWYGPTGVNFNACVPYLVKGETASNTPGYLSTSSSSSVALSTGGFGTFYSDPSCSSSTSTISFSSYSVWQEVYYKTASGSSTTFAASFSGLTTGNLNVTMGSAGSADHLAIYQPYSVTAGGTFSEGKGACKGMLIQVQDAAGKAISNGGSVSITFTNSPTGTYLYGNDGGCSTPSDNVSITPGYTNAWVYFKVPFTDANSSIAFTASASLLTSANITLTPTAPGTPTQLQFYSGNNITAGNCMPLQVVSTDSMGNPAPVGGSPVSVALSADSGTQFYSSAGCTGGSEVTSVSIPANDAYATQAYMKRTNAGSDTLHASGGGFSNANMGISINPGSAVQTVFVLPGQTLVPGASTFAAGVVGAPVAKIVNQTYVGVQAFIIDSYYNVVTTAGGSCSSIMTNDTYDTDGFSVNFTSGAATFNLNPSTSTGANWMILGSSSACSYGALDSAMYNVDP